MTPLRTTLPLLATLLLASASAAQDLWFAARLTGDQEVPPVNTAALGWGVVGLDSATNKVTIYVAATGLNANAAHLHQAPAGNNGGVIVPLTGGPQRWSGSGTLTAAQATALKSAGCYLNCHTTAFPGGEIRGQCLSPVSTRYVASLDGSQEVPPNNSTAKGTANAFFHEPDNVIVYVVRTTGLANITAAHFHMAPKGVNGGVVFPITASPSSPGTYCGVSPRLTAAQVTALKAEGLYVNVHTSAFPGGEIRGQVTTLGTPDLFCARLSGRKENPPNNSTATGIGCFELQPDGSLSYIVTVAGLRPTAAHIHRGSATANGPVLYPLPGGPITFSGTTAVLPPADLADLRAGNLYVNVHSAAFPGGEIRDQLNAATRPSTYGGGCRGSTRELPEIGASRFLCIGATSDVTLAGARKSTAAALLLGGSRTLLLNTVPLPLSLDSLGLTDCTLLTDFGTLPVLTAPTDDTGCARIPLVAPYELGLLDVNVFGQWLVLDVGANRANLVTSNGLWMKIY